MNPDESTWQSSRTYAIEGVAIPGNVQVIYFALVAQKVVLVYAPPLHICWNNFVIMMYVYNITLTMEIHTNLAVVCQCQLTNRAFA